MAALGLGGRPAWLGWQTAAPALGPPAARLAAAAPAPPARPALSSTVPGACSGVRARRAPKTGDQGRGRAAASCPSARAVPGCQHSQLAGGLWVHAIRCMRCRCIHHLLRGAVPGGLHRGGTARAAWRGVEPLLCRFSEVQGALHRQPRVHGCDAARPPPPGAAAAAAAAAAAPAVLQAGRLPAAERLGLEGQQLRSHVGRQPALRGANCSRARAGAGVKLQGCQGRVWRAQVVQGSGNHVEQGQRGLQSQAQEEPGQAQGALRHPHRRL